MTLKELKDQLNALPANLDNLPVILQKDAEGNGYSPLSDVDHEASYVPEQPWYGTVYSHAHSADDNCLEEKEWKKIKKNNRCIVLAPVN